MLIACSSKAAPYLVSLLCVDVVDKAEFSDLAKKWLALIWDVAAEVESGLVRSRIEERF